MNLILFDDRTRTALLPLTFTRPVADIRCGILTMREKWQTRLGIEESSSAVAAEYLKAKFPINSAADNIVAAGSVCVDAALATAVKALPANHLLADMNGDIVAGRVDAAVLETLVGSGFSGVPSGVDSSTYEGDIMRVEHPYHCFTKNGAAMEADYELLTAGRTSAPISDTNTVLGNRIFLEEGAKVEASILNSNTGPIYIGHNAEIMEGCVVRGGLAMCEGAVLKLAAKIYGPTTVGPYSKVGGEVNNSVLIGYSNKGHDGFLGNSVLGEWCNIGADSNNSNLKNNYAEVKLWSYETGRFAPTGLQFCGLVMGDHSKCGINTMFNTGTVVGVSCNIYGAGFPRNFVPSFSWGSAQKMMEYKVPKTFEVAERVMSRRKVDFGEVDKALLTAIFEETAQYRKY